MPLKADGIPNARSQGAQTGAPPGMNAAAYAIAIAEIATTITARAARLVKSIRRGAPVTEGASMRSRTTTGETFSYGLSAAIPSFLRANGRANAAGGLCAVARSYAFWYSAFALSC